MSCGVEQTDLSNVGAAFGLTAAAGLSTTVGAALSFCAPTKAERAKKFLAAALALAAGVMTYVSFVEIFATKTIESFSECVADNLAFLYGSLCFFGGIIITFLLEKFLHFSEHRFAERANKRAAAAAAADGDASSHDDGEHKETANKSGSGVKDIIDHTQSQTEAVGLSDSTDESPSAPAAKGVKSSAQAAETVDGEDEIAPAGHGGESGVGEENGVERDEEENRLREIAMDEELAHDGVFLAEMYGASGGDRKALARMGLFAGVAIAFHNFPEGLATFVAVLQDPSVGASVAIAIAIHNIPEGICVAMPIFYATGSRWKAFFWATLSGLTELVGAFLGWIVLRSVFTPIAYGVLFGLVAGMMVYISLKELLPTAHRYDPEDAVSTLFFCIGMVIMALSLVLFLF